MTKYKLMDIVALTGALTVLVLVTVLLPQFWPVYMRIAIGFVLSAIGFAIYYVIRTPDDVIALAVMLEKIASNAKTIYNASGKLKPKALFLEEYLKHVSTEIAKLAKRILRREFKHLAPEIQRLESASKSFADLCSFLTEDGSYLKQEQLYTQILEMESKWIPETLKIVEELNASIDANQAKTLISSEKELELIARLYDSNSAAHKAAETLKQILERKE